jgi:hypothetical protein
MNAGHVSGSSLGALLALSAFAVSPAQAQCISSGTAITCTGGITPSSSLGLGGGGKDTLNLEGGTLVGNVTSSGNSPDTFNLDGGRVEGSIDAGNGSDTFNLTGSIITGSLFGGLGPDIFNLSGVLSGATSMVARPGTRLI